MDKTGRVHEAICFINETEIRYVFS